MSFPRLLILCCSILVMYGHGQVYNFVGDASQISNDCYRLTDEELWENSAIWYNDPIDISEPFNLQFQMYFGNNDAGGADGMVFVMQQAGNNALGVAGGGIGFEGFSPSIGVEFDTWQNAELGDPAFDHLAVLLNGVSNHNGGNNLAGPIPISPTSDDVEDAGFYTVDIFWQPSTNQFSISVNCEVRLSVNISLESFVFSNNAPIYWGFTGATGGNFNEQIVCLDPFILGLPEEFSTCLGEPVALTAPFTNLGTVSWEPEEFLDDPNSFNPIATVNETTTFTLTYEDLCGNQEVDQTTIVVENPEVDLGGDIAICPDEEVVLQVDISYQDVAWSNGEGGNFTTVSSPGEYYVDAFLDGCPVSDTIEVILNPAPSYDGELNLGICEGDTFSLDLGADITEIEWFDGSQDPDRVFTQAGIYPFELSNGLCTSENTLEIQVVDITSFSLGEDISVCDDVEVILSADGSFDDVIWSDQSSQSTLLVSESGAYYVDVMLGSCEASDTIEVEIFEIPTFEGEDEVDLCQGEEYTFQVNNPEFSIEWFDGSTAATRTFNEQGSYAFTLTNGPCDTDGSIEIQVFDLTNFSLGEDISACSDEEVILSANLNFNSIIWSDGSTDSVLNIDESGTYFADVFAGSCQATDTIIVEIIDVPVYEGEDFAQLCDGEEYFFELNNPTYSVEWFDGNTSPSRTFDQEGVFPFDLIFEGCIGEFQFELDYTPIPEFELGSDLSLCLGEDLDLSVNAVGADVLWSTGAINSSIPIEEDGTYWALATLGDCSFSDTIDISFLEVPSLSLEGSTEICPNEQTVLVANTNSPVVWSTGEFENQILISGPGNYTVVATNSVDCTTEASITVMGLELPRIDPIETVVKCEDESFVRVIAQSNNDNALVWSNDDEGPSTRIDLIGEYSVSLTNVCGSDVVRFTVVEEECFDLFFMPNAFTPDGDGLNDIFKPIVGPHEEFEMRIVNRIGEEVFATKDASRGWDGSFQNDEYFCPTGIYTVYYMVKFEDFNVLENYGSVTLIR